MVRGNIFFIWTLYVFEFIDTSFTSLHEYQDCRGISRGSEKYIIASIEKHKVWEEMQTNLAVLSFA